MVVGWGCLKVDWGNVMLRAPRKPPKDPSSRDKTCLVLQPPVCQLGDRHDLLAPLLVRNSFGRSVSLAASLRSLQVLPRSLPAWCELRPELSEVVSPQ